MEKWILIDISNGDALDIQNARKVYFWSFETKADALRHKRWQARRKNGARLLGPFRFYPGDKIDGARYSFLSR